MIDQPEVGILGFVCVRQGRRVRWLVQHKPEPGNVGYFQLAPTVQATRSNYERVHGGAPTPLLELFTDQSGLTSDVENSEQGDRFLGKFNRNAKRLVDAPFDPPTGPARYEWLSAANLKGALSESYAVNTDARSVIASGAWHLLASEPGMFLTDSLPADVATALHQSYLRRSSKRITAARRLTRQLDPIWMTERTWIPLDDARHHRIDQDGIVDREGRRVVGYFDVHLTDREVPVWQQPLLERDRIETCLLLFVVEQGVARFNVMAYPEVGFVGRAELGPTLQTGTGPAKIDAEAALSMLRHTRVIAQIDQSDEGGRFYRNVSRYRLAQWVGHPNRLHRPRSIWLTAGELEALSTIPGTLTNELRTLLSMLISRA